MSQITGKRLGMNMGIGISTQPKFESSRTGHGKQLWEQKHLNILLALSRYDYRTHRGVATFASKHNWHLNCDMAISGHIPKRWRGDGIVCLLTEEDTRTADFVQSLSLPFVDLSVIREDIPAPRVSADHEAIGHTAAQYFLAKGFKHFAYFSTSTDKVAALRKASFVRKIKQHGKTHHDWGFAEIKTQNINDAHNSAEPDFNAIILKNIAASDFPLALFCTRDSDASLVLDACLQANIGVPEQVSILGVDNNELISTALSIPLSSVNHNVEALGYAGAELLHQIILGEVVPEPALPAKLIAPNGVTSRRSTDCLAVNSELVRSAIKHIHNHFQNHLYSVAKTAEHCGVSRRHLDNLFMRELGHSMHSELMNNRLRMAQNALKNSDETVELISEKCGFTRAQYFNAYFKKITGKTPLKFRKDVNAKSP